MGEKLIPCYCHNKRNFRLKYMLHLELLKNNKVLVRFTRSRLCLSCRLGFSTSFFKFIFWLFRSILTADKVQFHWKLIHPLSVFLQLSSERFSLAKNASERGRFIRWWTPNLPYFLEPGPHYEMFYWMDL